MYKGIKKIALITLILAVWHQLYAQNDTLRYQVELSGLASSGEYSPFWMHSNQYDKMSPDPMAAFFSAAVYKPINEKSGSFQYGFGANLILRTDSRQQNFYIHELYAKAKWLVFDLTIGAKEEILGNQDSTLSCGGLLFSENSRPMPKITIGIEHFTPVPFTGGWLEVKGALTHGWINDNAFGTGELLHHKYLYAKIGGKLPVHLQYGLDHVAQWGGNLPYFGQQPIGLRDYIDIFFGKAGGSDATTNDQLNALGNHIISQSMRLDVDFSGFSLGAYWQNVNEDGPIRVIWNSMDLPDGLWGISLRNNKIPFVQGIVYEYLNTTDQSGPYHDRDGLIYGGDDNDFNNGIYQAGWTYFSMTVGTPLISSPYYNKNHEIGIFNNRVQAHHFGVEGNIKGYKYKILATFSKNYGTYNNPFPKMLTNDSYLLQINKKLLKTANIEIGTSLGWDKGELFGNSFGGMITIRKTGDLFHY